MPLPVAAFFSIAVSPLLTPLGGRGVQAQGTLKYFQVWIQSIVSFIRPPLR